MNNATPYVLILIAWVLFALADMWFDIVTMATFIKLSATCVVALVLVFAFYLSRGSGDS